MHKFYVVSDRSDEVSVLRKVKPREILVSYLQFKNKSLYEFILKLGYNPVVFVDSGAYTAYRRGLTIDYNDYMMYVSQCYDYWKHPKWQELHKDNVMSFPMNTPMCPLEIMQPLCIRFIALDVIGDA